MTAQGSSGHSLRLVRILPAPPDQVFAAWTDVESLKQWMCPGATSVPVAELDARIGGHFKIVMTDEKRDYIHTGEYLEVDPPNRLVFTWISDATHSKRSMVTVEFRPHGDGETEVVLIHEQLPDEEAVARHRGGWNDIAAKLAAHFSKKG